MFLYVCLQDMLYYYFNGFVLIDGGVNDVRAVGTLVLVLLMGLAIVGMDWVTRVSGHGRDVN